MIKQKLLKIDHVLSMAVFFILGLGLLTVIASTYEPNVGISGLAKTQIVVSLVGLALFFFFSFVNYRVFRSVSIFMYLSSLALLVAVLFIGKSVYGATSWIDLGLFQFQPSELAKLSVILILARFFSTRTGNIDLSDIMISGLFTLPVLVLVLLQPDFGTAMVILVIWFSLVFAARPKIGHLTAIGLPVLAAVPIVWNLLKGYQKSRILVFVNSVLGRPIPEEDSLGAAYNVLQSQIAVGSGGLFGRGIGQGTQGSLNFLPSQSQQTDFAFAIFVEQLGFIGGLLLLALFYVLFFRIVRAANLAKDGFGMYVAFGTFSMIFFHALVSIGMNMGIMPVTGIPLPLFSYGGTALIAACIGLGIVQSVFKHRKALEFVKH